MKLSAFSLSELIKTWITSPFSLEKTRQLHALVLTTTIPSSPPFLHNNLISLYAKSGSPQNALKVFDTMPHRNLVSYNAAISACSRSPHLAGVGLGLFVELGRTGYCPNGLTLVRILGVLADVKDMIAGAAVHSMAIRLGFAIDSWVQTALLGMYSSCGGVKSANRVFSDMEEKDIVTWNAVIHGNVKNGNVQEGLRLFSKLWKEGIGPTEFTFSMALRACRTLADTRAGEIIHAQILKSKVLVDTALQNSLVVLYASSGDFAAALAVFDEIEVPGLVSWNSVISGYSDNRDAGNAIGLFVEMLSKCSDGLTPDDYTYAKVVYAATALPASLYGKPLHAQIEKFGLACSVYVSSTLIDMYFSNQEPDAAGKIFSLILVKDHIIWTAMIAGHSRAGECETAVRHFYDMIMDGHKVDSFSLSSVLNSCAGLGRIKQGQMVHSLALKTGYCRYMCVAGSLIDVYSKNGSLESACSAFDEVDMPDLKCWNAMLNAYGNHGHNQQVFELFDKITESGLEADHVTYLSLLSACCHLGLLERGRVYWKAILEKGFSPDPKHYSCMVNLLSRSRLLREAEELILGSPFADGFPEMWRALLSSCVALKELGIGVNASKRILMMNPDDSSTLIMLSNLYASLGRWEDVSNIRRRIRGLISNKDPGLSWIENEDKVHVFSAHGEFYTHSEHVEVELLSLHRNLKPWDDPELLDLNNYFI